MPPLTPAGQQSTAQRELLDAQKELLSASFSIANAYTNLILGAGYAGFFAVWAFTREHLTTFQVFWSAVLVTLSLLAFVMFEVFKAFYYGIALRGLSKAVSDEANFPTRLSAWKREQHDRDILFGRIWIWVFGVCVLSGFVGALILRYAFVRNLIRLHFHW